MFGLVGVLDQLLSSANTSGPSGGDKTDLEGTDRAGSGTGRSASRGADAGKQRQKQPLGR